MRMKKRRSIGSLVTYMLAVSVFLACCCTGALAVTENEASLVSEETGNTIEIPYAFGTLGGGLSDILLDGVSVQSVDYEIKLLPDADQVIKGERFAVEVLIDSETQETFGGAQGLLTYNKSLVHYEGVATKDADFDCSENAEGIMIAGAGAEKKISEDGYSIITLYFTALEDLAEEEYEAEFQLSDTMIAVNGQLTGKIPYSQKAVVRIVDEDFSNTYAITLPEEAVEVTGVTDGLVTVGTDVTFKVIGENNRVFVKIGDEAEKELVANGEGVYVIPGADITGPIVITVSSDSEGGGSAVTKYTVVFMDGDQVLSTTAVRKGAKVTAPEDPVREGYVFTGWYRDAACTQSFDFVTTITEDLTLYAGWEQEDTPSDIAFTDISDHWAEEAIRYVVTAGLFNGTSETLFSPNENMTRGMLVTVLWRLEGQPEGTMVTFEDVAVGSYYEQAIAWAQENGIVKGYSETKFVPKDWVTREQMAAIMARYSDYKGYDTSVRADLSGYIDHGSISSYAYENMQWANGVGLITGVSDTMLEPRENATRAQVATILQRFTEQVG